MSEVSKAYHNPISRGLQEDYLGAVAEVSGATLSEDKYGPRQDEFLLPPATDIAEPHSVLVTVYSKRPHSRAPPVTRGDRGAPGNPKSGPPATKETRLSSFE